jgi:DNA-binding LytR/AlgR family response regulator
MTITALVADDELILLQGLCAQLERLWPELDIVARACNGVEALHHIEEFEPTVAFLDVKMPGLSGLEVADAAPNCHVVFVTAYDEFAIEAFDRQAHDYLLKPVTDERLQKTIDRLRSRITNQSLPAHPPPLQHTELAPDNAPLQWIRASIGNSVRLIALDKVCYFQADEKYTAVRTSDGEYLIRTPIKELFSRVDQQRFWLVSRSTLVNAEEIVQATRSETGRITLSLKSRPEQVAVSRNFAHLFKQM